MYCNNCGKEIAENSKFCPECGYHITNESPQDEFIFSDGYVRKTSVFGIIGFIGSLVAIGLYKEGWFQLFALAIPSLVFSIIGVNDKKHSKKGFSYAGLVLSICSIVICFWEPPFLNAILPI